MALFQALENFGAPLGKLTPADFIEKGSFFTMGVPPVAIDILPEIKGVAFAAAWKNRATLVVDAESGLTAHFISCADLIASKLAAGRPQALADVDALRKAAGITRSPTSPKNKSASRRKPQK